MRDVNHVPWFNLIEWLWSKEFVIVDLWNFKTKSSEVYLRLFKEEEWNPNVIIWDRETNTKIFTKIEYTVSLNWLNEDEKTLLKNLIIEKLKKDSSGDLSAMIDKFLDS